MRTLIFSIAVMALGVGCGDDGVKPSPDAPPLHDASVDSGTPTCFSGTPTTHEQIINACTSAQGIEKTTKPPLLLPDGALPALPP